MSRTITLSSPAMPVLSGEPALVLTRLEGEEALSTLYSYTLTVKTPANPLIPWQTASNVDLKALIGKEMTVTIELDGNGLDTRRGVGKGQREISGLVEKARYISRDANQAMFEIILRPWLCLSTLTTDFKIFQNKNVVEIIEEVLSEYPFPFEKRLTASYPSLDFQVQYGESDFAFIERLMEEWGIYWFYEHQEQKHKLILVDHVGSHKTCASAAYHELQYAPENPKAAEEYISEFCHEETLTSGRWVTNDYDFTKSRADIMALDVKPRKTSFSELEMYHWPGDYDQPGTGEQLARIRIEERGAQGSRATGSGELRGVVCGTNFVLKGYPVKKANREYMVISSHLAIQEIDQLSCEASFSVMCRFTVQPTTKIYRHPQTVPKPRTHGPQNAIVVGPPGEEVWTDEYGRVKVRFVWDRYGQNSEEDSCWIRVSQAWAGNSFGGIYIPRVGHEVIVDFINGDPDRPLIIGSLYNNVTLPPWGLPANATQSGMISRTIGGGKTNYNGVRFEDKPGREKYWEQAERDMSRLTKNNEKQVIGANSSLNVGSNRSEVVGANFNKSVLGASTTLIGGVSSFQVGLGHSVVIGGLRSVSIGLTDATNVAGARAVNVGGANLANVGGYDALSVGGAWQRTVGGAATLLGGGAVAIGSGGELLLTGRVIKIIGKERIVIQGGAVQINPGDCDDYHKGGGGGVGLSGLASLAGLALLAGGIGLPIPLPKLPIPPKPSPTESPAPTITEPPEPTTTEPPEPTTTEPPAPPTTEPPAPTTTEPPAPTTTEPPTPTTTEPPAPTTTEPPEPTTTEPPAPTTTEPPAPTTTEPPTPEPTSPEPTTSGTPEN